MESYPSEFIGHAYPLLLVAGLAPPPQPQGQPPAPDADPPQPGPAGETAPVASSDPFVILQAALRKTLASRKAFPVWDPARGKGQNEFYTILVDKNIRFPPLKARPAPSNAQQPPQPLQNLHSPISPLTPTSPLYPDGIIAPIWIRKHRELVPAVFVLVLRLFEHPPGSNVDPTTREEEERERDGGLVQEIVDRKRTTYERGIKLAVVLLCSRELLDDPSLDFRLSLIRRQSGLDTRASLFVISPVPQSEVHNFVQSLREELYPAAIDYYREHSRRVRRKRARIGGNAAAAVKGALSERGWNVRYDYKLALFAELRNEVEVALKHFEDCYATLVDTFSHPELLVPRTKRWAEAKVLADCISFKICKLYLYLGESSRAVAQLHKHVSLFLRLSSETWSIGVDTFEFWSWLSKQYRLFGDLVALAVRNGIRLPSTKPPPMPAGLPPVSRIDGTSTPPTAIANSPSLVPLNVLQHAGYYYHLAATCAVERRERFKEAKGRAEEEGGEGAGGPALAHETKVDHGEIIIELFTKAYEFYKVHKAKNMTYAIAHQIALAHLEAGKLDMALKFHDRIAKSYRQGKYDDVLADILLRIFEAAKGVQDWNAAVKAGIELMTPESRIDVMTRERVAKDVMEILQSHGSADSSTVSLDMTEFAPLLDCRLAFLHDAVDTSTTIPFQLVLSSLPTSRFGGFAFSRIEITFNDDRPPISIDHRHDTDADIDRREVVNLGNASSSKKRVANLAWRDGGEAKLFVGSIKVDKEIDLTVEKVVLTASIGSWTVTLIMRPDRPAAPTQSEWYIEAREKPKLLKADGASRSVSRRNICVDVDTSFVSPSYLDERLPISVDVRNDDEVDVELFLVIFLQPGEEGSHDTIEIDSQSSTSVIESLPLGTLAPSTSLSKTFVLSTLGGLPGPRNIDVTIRAVPIASADSTLSDPLPPKPLEVTRSLVVSVISPVQASFSTQVLKRRRPNKALLDMSEPSGWEGASVAMMAASFRTVGPWGIEMQSIVLRTDDAPQVRAMASSLGYVSVDQAQREVTTWRPGDVFNALFSLEVRTDDSSAASNLHLEIRWKKADGESTVTRLKVHPPKPPPLAPTVVLRLPPYLVLHQPVTLSYRFSNPTSRLHTLSSQLDLAEIPSAFAFAGPRRLTEWTLAPFEDQEMRVRLVPLIAGRFALPRMRVWQIEYPAQPVQDAYEDEEQRRQQAQQPKATELEVQIESDVVEEREPSQVELEADLKTARGGDDGAGGGKASLGSAPVVLVLPR
ncbi:glutathione transferase omega-1 [Rhodotorula toruloides]|uniref:Glutathione transferase omega-1 n=1 Tax=Rhodotorula toruloides TaxID=5286 RepID=A0A511K922_RHOTO|nr:glutathione transferase omega-1 [Rhodotorula toruloides]